MDELKPCPFCREKDKDIAYLKRRVKAEEDGYMEENKRAVEAEKEIEIEKSRSAILESQLLDVQKECVTRKKEIEQLKRKNKKLEEYKWMYEDLCK